jgi:hypothetical protein
MIKWYKGGEYYFRDMLFSVALVTFQNFLKKHKTFLFQGGWIIWIVVCVCVCSGVGCAIFLEFSEVKFGINLQLAVHCG